MKNRVFATTKTAWRPSLPPRVCRDQELVVVEIPGRYCRTVLATEAWKIRMDLAGRVDVTDRERKDIGAELDRIDRAVLDAYADSVRRVTRSVAVDCLVVVACVATCWCGFVVVNRVIQFFVL